MSLIASIASLLNILSFESTKNSTESKVIIVINNLVVIFKAKWFKKLFSAGTYDLSKMRVSWRWNL